MCFERQIESEIKLDSEHLFSLATLALQIEKWNIISDTASNNGMEIR